MPDHSIHAVALRMPQNGKKRGLAQCHTITTEQKKQRNCNQHHYRDHTETRRTVVESTLLLELTQQIANASKRALREFALFEVCDDLLGSVRLC